MVQTNIHSTYLDRIYLVKMSHPLSLLCGHCGEEFGNKKSIKKKQIQGMPMLVNVEETRMLKSSDQKSPKFNSSAVWGQATLLQ